MTHISPHGNDTTGNGIYQTLENIKKMSYSKIGLLPGTYSDKDPDYLPFLSPDSYNLGTIHGLFKGMFSGGIQSNEK